MDRLALSALDWWDEAGVDILVDESPRDWLARAIPAPEQPSQTPAAVPVEPAPIPVAYPADLAAFRAWLLSDATIPGRTTTRLDAVGDAASGTMILIDMPESEDRTGRTLLSGDEGALLDRMLGAMQMSRETIYLASFSPARPATGNLDAKAIATLLPAARHHLTLVAPKRLLLMGDAPSRALLGLGSNEGRGRAHSLDLDGRAIPTIATFTPRFILQASSPEDLKARRAKVWADLQLFMAL